MGRQAIVGDFGVEFPLTVVAAKTRGSRRVWYKPNHRSFGAFMKSEQMRDVTAEVAQDISFVAMGLTPMGEPDISSERTDLHRRVRKGFEVKREAGLIKVGGNLRVNVEIENNADGAALVEFGANNLRRVRMLARAGALFGDFKPKGGPS